MRQVLQVLGTGEIRVEDVPAPQVLPGGVLVRTAYSVVSVGTDRMQLEFGRKSLVGKALEKPEQVRQILASVSRDGLGATRERIERKLTDLVAFGYSSAGVVEAVGDGVTEFHVGQRVACAGAGYASHAERSWVPRNLVAAVPDDARLDHAAFATMGAIALHGVRQAEVRLGESVAVIGLGLLGQITMQLVRAAGARPIGIDVDAARVALAGRWGVAIPRAEAEGAVAQATAGLGADAVIIAAATSSDDPIRLAGRIARDRAKVVVSGAVPIDVPRSPYFEKELDVRLSRSYGPGRYDPSYEEKGVDYPVGYVRWTEGRNLGEIVRLIAEGELDIEPLITHRFGLEDAADAYGAMGGGGGERGGEGGLGTLGVVIEYSAEPRSEPSRIEVRGAVGSPAPAPALAPAQSRPGLALIGAGAFATDMLLPILGRLKAQGTARLTGVVSAGGVSALAAAKRFPFGYAAGSIDEILDDPDTHAVVIATRHADHAELATRALLAGKAVYVEKPLALDDAGLDMVLDAARGGPQLMVGFNRRFAPATSLVTRALARTSGARVIQIRVNAGAIPARSWVHDPAVGGGRLVGEGCHFIDLAAFLVGSRIATVSAAGIEGGDPDAALGDNVAITLGFADGSLASIVYTSKGATAAGKERIEVFAGGMTAVIDDFRDARVYGQGSGSRGQGRWKGRSDKGHAAALAAFIDCIRNGATSPIPLDELEDSSRATLRTVDALRSTDAPATIDAVRENGLIGIGSEA